MSLFTIKRYSTLESLEELNIEIKCKQGTMRGMIHLIKNYNQVT
uniref:Uncharacterized protein n=1 Tax=Tetranychus urticae TaxID=32264 RepID=T1K4Z4_TETUR